MELKTIIIDGKEVEIAIKLNEEYYEKNENLLENTLKLDKIENENE